MRTITINKKATLILGLLVFATLTIHAQEVVQESLDWKKIRIRSLVSMTAPLAHEENPVLPINLNLEGSYELGQLADFRGGLSYGTFKGISVGGTFHLRDAVVNRATRFIVAETGSRVYFYKGRADHRVVTGPTANFQIGSYSATGTYTRFDAGFDFQRFSHAYYNGYHSAKNGFTSIKLLGTVSKFNQFEVGEVDELKSRIGMGGLVSYTAELKPWKWMTLYSDVEFGYMTIFGAKDYFDGYTNLRNTKSNIILGLKIGASFGL